MEYQQTNMVGSERNDHTATAAAAAAPTLPPAMDAAAIAATAGTSGSDVSLGLSDSPDKPLSQRTARSASTVSVRLGRGKASPSIKRNASTGGRVTVAVASRQKPRMPVSRSPMRRLAEKPDWLPGAVHRRVERNLELAAPGINDQFEADREQITMLRKAVEGLHNMIMMQDTAYTELRGHVQELQHLDHQARQRHREVSASVEDLNGKLLTAGGMTQRNFEELRNRIVDPPIGAERQTRVDKIEADLKSLGAMFLQKVARDNEVENYLMEVEGKKPKEGEALFQALKYLHGELTNLKQQVIEHTGTTAGIINGIAQKNLSDGELARLSEMEQKVNQMHLTYVQGQQCDQTQQRIQALEGRLDHYDYYAVPCGQGFTGVDAQHGAPQPCTQGGRCPCPPGIPAGQPGGSQDGLPFFVTAQHGGNGACHCKHVVQLEAKKAELERRVGQLERAGAPRAAPASGQRPNFTNMYARGNRDQAADGGGDGGDRRDGELPTLEPLGPLGLLVNPEKQLYDDKLTAQAEYKYNGHKNGPAWKSKVERYFMSKVPALKQILKWAEKHDQTTVTEEMLATAVHGHRMDETQQQMLNASIWGFLSGCVTSTAETMFKRAPQLNGLDAWRRIVRIIDNGFALRQLMRSGA